MPATCFSGPPRSAGAIAAALPPQLAAALTGVVRYGARPSVSQRLVCTGGLKCKYWRTRTAAGVGASHGCAALACLPASVLHR